MAKTLYFFLMLLALAATALARKPKRLDNVGAEAAKLAELARLANKLLDDVEDGKEATLRLQTFASKFYVYAQDMYYRCNLAHLNSKDVEAREKHTKLTDMAGVSTYGIGKQLNGNFPLLKKAIKKTISDTEYLFPLLDPVDRMLLDKEKDQFASNYVRMSYDLLLFLFNMAHEEMKHIVQDTSNIIVEIRKSSDKMLGLLKTIPEKDANVLEEFTVHIHSMCFFTDRFAARIDTWVYASNKGSSALKGISDVPHNLRRIVKDLRNHAGSNATLSELQANAETFLNGATDELKKLAELGENDLGEFKELRRDFLLEALSILTWFSVSIELLQAK